MKNPVPTIPMKANNAEGPIFMWGVQLPPFWVDLDWLKLICMRKPELKLSFDKKTHVDWALFDQIDILAEKLGVSFADVASWALLRALGDRFEDARRMKFQGAPWDPDLLYVCRVVALQLCQCRNKKAAHTIKSVDDLIGYLLTSEEEFLMAMREGKTICC